MANKPDKGPILTFKDIDVYSLGCGILALVLGGYLQTHYNSPSIALAALCFALALYLIISPIIQARNYFERKADNWSALFRENEGLYNAITLNTTDAIFSVNENSVIQTFNPAAETLFGYGAWDVIGKSPHMLFSDTSLNIQSNISVKTEAMAADGNAFPVMLSINKATIDNKTFYVFIVRDIPESKIELEEKDRQLRDNEERLALAVEGGGFGFWDWDISSGKVTFSEGWVGMLGYRVHELEDSFETWKGLVHPDDVNNAIECIESYFAGKTPSYENEFRMQHKDGSWRRILSRGKVFEFDDSGNPLRAVGTHLDVTERLKQQGRLDFLTSIIIQSNEAVSQEEYLRSILSIICKYIRWPIGHAYVWDLDEECFKSSGCWYIEDIETDISEFRQISDEMTFEIGEGLPGTIAQIAESCWIETIGNHHPLLSGRCTDNTGLSTAFAFPIFVHSQVCVVLEFFSVVPSEEDNELFLLWEAVGAQLSRAIEKHKNAKEREIQMLELENAKEEAHRANKMKSDFLTNMSHEIRTPLNGIIGATDLLKRTKVTDDQRKYLDLIYNSGDTLLVLINDILDLSKIEAGELEILPEKVNIRSLIHDTVQAIAPKAESKNIELAINISQKIPQFIFVDDIRLKQILINLLGNAVKFVEKGFISVVVTPITDPDENISLRFKVQDTGIGIPKEKLESIFDKFAQVDATTTKKYGGTGLGLAITQRLVDLMNGTIGVESEEGKGTEFWFEITVPVDIDNDSSILPQEVSLDGENLKVLVVDDMEISLTSLSATLEELHIDYATASDARTGLSMIEEAQSQGNPFNVVLIDYLMPDMNGRDMANALRKADDFRDIRIILMSAISKLEAAGMHPDTWQEEIFDGYLIKPISSDQLLNKLATISGESETMQSTNEPLSSDVSDEKITANILLVENEMVNQMVATDMLENLGCTVSLAENGQEALDMLEGHEEAYDVVLMDCMMPVLDGFEATKKIREREGNSDVRKQIIIAMTANAMTGERDKCIEAGMDDYLAKPVKESDLYSKLKEYISSGDLL